MLNDKNSTPRLVLLDADTVFTQAIVDRSVSDGRPCQHSSDCDFFDCHSLCNRVLNICDTRVLNNNLQLICKKIFIDSGLLISPSSHFNNLIPEYQQVLLKECADPYSSGGRQSAPLQLLNELNDFLSQYLSMIEV